MELRLSSRLDGIHPSVTMAVQARAAELARKGVEVTSFGAGEPDFDTPEHIKEAARRALADGTAAKYTDVKGIPALLHAIAEEESKVHGVSYRSDQVIVSMGAKHSLFNLFLALLNEGDQVIVPAPYWVSYPEMIRLAGAEPIIAPTTADKNFAISGAGVRKLVTPKTRAIVLNTPSNPTGAVYTRKQLEDLAEAVLEHKLWVISDDIYRQLVYGEARYVSMPSLSRELAEQTIVVDGVSKTYAMTGWRIGYTLGPKPLIDAMAKIQSQSTSNPASVAQYATLAALTGDQSCVATMRREFDSRRQVMVEMLRSIPGVSCREPQGAFYAFPDLSSYLGSKTPDGQLIDSDVALSTFLLTSEVGRVAVVPGSGFGAPGFVRLSYACGMADIKNGLGRMKLALGTLHR